MTPFQIKKRKDHMRGLKKIAKNGEKKERKSEDITMG